MSLRSWLVAAVVVFALGATRCDRDVQLGAAPASDAAASDAGDAGQGG
jgi:hypothetical protein